MTDVITIAENLIRCPSVTPKDEGAQVYLAKFLSDLGFECHHLKFGDVPNLFARLGTEGPHICYAGHTDVVPTGPLAKWTSPPFEPTVRGGKLYGRGASDMKGSVAAFVAGVADYLKQHGKPKGSISFLITGDEEGVAINGTVKVLHWMKENGHVPDVCLVGEPTNPSQLGEEIKIGRRGSLSAVLKVAGKQGHVAYQHLADNPLPRLIKMLDALNEYVFDKGNEFFPPTNLEVTTIDVGNTASNVIPGEGTAHFNIRFNDIWYAQSLIQKIREILDGVSKDYTLETSDNSKSFLTQPGEWSNLVRQAVKDITGRDAPFTTSGGTSDARFIFEYCPVVEFGPVNATIHQIDENADVKVLQDLARVYTRVLELYFSP